MKRVITLTTDFGTSDGYVGAMKGVILSINPDAALVDITHEIAPQNVEQGAFLFGANARYFPSNAIHIVVVDPGVGSARRPLALQRGQTILVGPDNGVLSLAIDGLPAGPGESTPAVRAVHLNRPQYWLPRVSRTFHGRDIFAPCAAHLSLGVPLESLGEPVQDWVRLAVIPPTRRDDGAIVGRVRHIDRFGNVVIDVADSMLAEMDPSQARVQVAGRELALRQTYSDAAPGELVALMGSTGYLEVAQRNGNAATELGVRVGDAVTVMP